MGLFALSQKTFNGPFDQFGAGDVEKGVAGSWIGSSMAIG
jgi:hypothetical protein